MHKAAKGLAVGGLGLIFGCSLQSAVAKKVSEAKAAPRTHNGQKISQVKEKIDEALLKKAKVTKQQAQATAMKKAPGGTFKEIELEDEDGKLIWSFDIAWHGKIKEVEIDAITGKVTKVEIEDPKQEAREQALEKEKDAGDDK